MLASWEFKCRLRCLRNKHKIQFSLRCLLDPLEFTVMLAGHEPLA